MRKTEKITKRKVNIAVSINGALENLLNITIERKPYTGILQAKEREIKSKILLPGNFFLLVYHTENNAPPRSPPVNEKPGKYGNARNTRGLRYTGFWFCTMNNKRDKINAKMKAKKIILKTCSADVFFRSIIKSSRTK